MAVMLKPICWLLGHSFGPWKRVGACMIREYATCGEQQRVPANGR